MILLDNSDTVSLLFNRAGGMKRTGKVHGVLAADLAVFHHLSLRGPIMARNATLSLVAAFVSAWLTSLALAETNAPAAASVESASELAAWLDALVAKLWEENELEPAPVVDDATYLRRVYLDLLGTIPSVAETRDFLSDYDPDRRRKLVERLLDDRRYAEQLARTWRRAMVPGDSPGAAMAPQLDPWLREQFRENVPYDELARRVLTASGEIAGGRPVVFYAAVGNRPENLASEFSRVFLGVRIGCAQCHDHPFARWTQEDFWSMAAFFAGTNTSRENIQAVVDSNRSTIRPPNSEREYSAKFLWGEATATDDERSPRAVLADWMTSPENENFSATAVNRVWRHLFGRALVAPVDELDLAAPEERALVLDELAQKFSEQQFDLRWLIEGLCQSELYQRASEGSSDDARLFTHRPLKTLTPEQVFDALEQALALPISRGDGSPRYNGQAAQFIARLNESYSDSPEEYRAGIPQVLLLMNGRLVDRGTSLEHSRTLRAVTEAPFLNESEKIETLYLAVLTRRPRRSELPILLGHVEQQANEVERQHAYAEIFWALLNSPEFVLNR